jgi:hypothetical protein
MNDLLIEERTEAQRGEVILSVTQQVSGRAEISIWCDLRPSALMVLTLDRKSQSQMHIRAGC